MMATLEIPSHSVVKKWVKVCVKHGRKQETIECECSKLLPKTNSTWLRCQLLCALKRSRLSSTSRPETSDHFYHQECLCCLVFLCFKAVQKHRLDLGPLLPMVRRKNRRTSQSLGCTRKSKQRDLHHRSGLLQRSEVWNRRQEKKKQFGRRSPEASTALFQHILTNKHIRSMITSPRNDMFMSDRTIMGYSCKSSCKRGERVSVVALTLQQTSTQESGVCDRWIWSASCFVCETWFGFKYIHLLD